MWSPDSGATTPGNLLEMQILQPQPRPTEADALRAGSAVAFQALQRTLMLSSESLRTVPSFLLDFSCKHLQCIQ